MAKTPKPVILDVIDEEISTENSAKVIAALSEPSAQEIEALFTPDTTALDAALTKARTLHIDSSTSEGLSVLYVRDALVAALDEVRALLLHL